MRKKLLETSNFSFFHNVFYSYISLMRQNAVMYGNGLTDDKNLNWSKLKTFADDKTNVKEKLKFGL